MVTLVIGPTQKRAACDALAAMQEEDRKRIISTRLREIPIVVIRRLP
jgi:hypothetical protein